MIYKIFTLPYKPDFEYYNKSGVWYRRSKLNPSDGWKRSDNNAQKVLNEHFKKQRRFLGWNYNVGTKLVAVSAMFVVGYFAYKFVNKK
jgi:hypothetical protein